MKTIWLLPTMLVWAACSSAPVKETPAPDALEAVIAGEQRSPENKARDKYRHPLETLRFFGIRPDMNVVEVSPGAGWYTEILAPYLNAHGQFIATAPATDTTVEYMKKMRQGLEQKLASRPDLYGKAIITEFAPPKKTEIAPPGFADLVLTFRNVHNWMASGNLDTALTAFYTALKPGGVLGVVEHRAPETAPQNPTAPTGYVRQDFLIAAAERAGFKLVATSEINANPNDTKDHPKGVWTLPPTLRLGDQDRAKYLAIGESDRMTLKFVKPQ